MMREIADRLNRVGHPIRTLPELRRNTIPIPAAAGLIARFLRERDLRGVVVVAHSKGGLIAKSLLLGEESDCIARVIAIATPFAGSSLATWMPSRTLRALRPADPTIAALVAELAVNARIVSVYPAFDPHIPGGSRLEGARNVPVSATGHFRVLGSPEVIDAVERHASPTVEG
ncbi:alpha/beta hydrolase [Leucobacter zeae]|nr:alpha/beta hydrolase [Leucobacter zeae]